MSAGMHLLVSDTGPVQLRRPDRNSSEATPSNSRTSLLNSQPISGDTRRRLRRSPRPTETLSGRQQHLRHQAIRISWFTSSARAVHSTHSPCNSCSVRVRRSAESQRDSFGAQQNQTGGRICICWYQQCTSTSAVPQPHAKSRNASVCWVKKRRTTCIAKWDTFARTRRVFWIRWGRNIEASLHGFIVTAAIYISRFATCQCTKYTRIRFRYDTSRCFRRFGTCWSIAFIEQQNRCNTRTPFGNRATCKSCTFTRQSYPRCSKTWDSSTWWCGSPDGPPQSLPLRLSHPWVIGRTVSQWKCGGIPRPELLHFPFGVERATNGCVGLGGYWAMPGTSDSREPRSVERDLVGGRCTDSALPSAATANASVTAQVKPPLKLTQFVAIASIVFHSVCARYLLLLRSECIRDTCKTISA